MNTLRSGDGGEGETTISLCPFSVGVAAIASGCSLMCHSRTPADGFRPGKASRDLAGRMEQPENRGFPGNLTAWSLPPLNGGMPFATITTRLPRPARGEKKEASPMFRTILVPLDGSPFAEQALPWALSLARRAGARLDLVRGHSLYALKEPAAAWAPFNPARGSPVQAGGAALSGRLRTVARRRESGGDDHHPGSAPSPVWTPTASWSTSTPSSLT